MIKVAITAAGGGVAQSIIKSLAYYEYLSSKAKEYFLVGIDPDPRAAGLYMVDKGRLGPKLNDPDFVERLIQICKEEDCKYLFPGFDAELPILAAHRDEFLAAGITPIVSSPEVVELSDSKWSMYQFLKQEGLPHIPTYRTALELLKHWEPSPSRPAIMKPERGCRSQGVWKIDDSYDEEASFFYSHESLERPTFVHQEYIDGPEYTCGTVSFDGNVLGVICMERELRNGDTYKAKVNQNPVVLEFVHNLISKIKPFGPCNVQLRLRDNIPYVLEINARCSGTTAARTLAGFNEPKIVLDYLEDKEVKFKIEDGLEIYRYWNEIVVHPENKVSK